MDNKKQVVGSSSSSSSLTMDLFGPRDVSADSTVTSGLFGTVFPPASTVLARAKKPMRKHDYGMHMTPENQKGESNNSMINNDRNSVYHNQSVDQPGYYNSSIYYGGQEEVYTPPQSSKPTPPHPVYKKDGGENDRDGNNSNDASRGNWWKGSLYY